MARRLRNPSISEHGWRLVSAAERRAENPDSFSVPDDDALASLRAGQAVKLLFDIETRLHGEVADRGVDRMWVVVTDVLESGFLGVLVNDPGVAEGLALCEGDEIAFCTEHVASVAEPPRDYLEQRFGNRYRR